MGLIQHKSIIITSWESLEKIRNMAIDIFGEVEDGEKCVSEVVGIGMNGYKSFFISPDGSKEYWELSDIFDLLYKKMCDYIDTLAYEDGSNSYEYVFISYGELGNKILKSNCNHD